MIARLFVLLAIALSVLCAGSAQAHLTPNSEVNLVIRGDRVSADIIVPQGEYAYATGNPVGAQPGAAAGSFDPTLTLARTGGGGPYQQNSWGVQDIASANADFHVGGFRNHLVLGLDASYQRADRTLYAYTLPPGPELEKWFSHLDTLVTRSPIRSR